MFLRNYSNYWTLLNSMDSSYKTCTTLSSDSSHYELRASSSTTQWGDGFFNIKTTNGALSGCNYIASHYYKNTSSYNSWSAVYGPIALTASHICLGTGDAPVAYDDYKLSGTPITLTGAQKSTKTSWIPETKQWRRTTVCTYTNLTEADVIVKEWGIYKHQDSSSTTGSAGPAYSNSSAKVALMFREVLAEPITIKAGTTSTLTFSIDIPMPNHP